jgi:hypothetical protein
MSTQIEQFLYRETGTYAVVQIAPYVKRLVIGVAPWNNLAALTIAEFVEAKITSIDVCAQTADDLNLPWDIIGFDDHRLADERWCFVMHCAGIEYCFEARWPQFLTSPQR